MRDDNMSTSLGLSLIHLYSVNLNDHLVDYLQLNNQRPTFIELMLQFIQKTAYIWRSNATAYLDVTYMI